MENQTEYIQISTTFPKKSVAVRIAEILLNGNLAACIQITGPITSVYRWKGKLEKTKEWLCVIKTKRTLCKNIEEEIKNNHPYELPEIVATPIIEGSREYLEWIKKEVSKK